MAPGVLWDIRDNRTLSEHAKLAYLMLWSRRPDIRPSMQTLAGDMAVSVATAKRAVRDLESAGLVKRIPRLTEHGDRDTNRFELTPPEGQVSQTPPPGQREPTPPVSQTPKDSNLKTATEGRKNPQASRRARPAAERESRITFVRIAVAEIYGQADEKELTDSQAVALWYQLVSNRRPKDPVAYLRKIFEETPYLDTHLANAGHEEDWQ